MLQYSEKTGDINTAGLVKYSANTVMLLLSFG